VRAVDRRPGGAGDVEVRPGEPAREVLEELGAQDRTALAAAEFARSAVSLRSAAA